MKFRRQIIFRLRNNDLGIKQLNFTSLGLGYVEIRLLSEALQYNTILEILRLGYNHISDDAMKHLCKALKINTTLKVLDLTSNPMLQYSVDYLGKALSINSTLKKLYLDEHEISMGWGKWYSMEELCKGLKVNKGLTHISFRNCCIMSQEMKFFSEMLKKNRTLTFLNFQQGNFGGIEKIREGMKYNNSITEIKCDKYWKNKGLCIFDLPLRNKTPGIVMKYIRNMPRYIVRNI